MKLLSVSLARSVWLFNLADLNPRGLSAPDLFEKLVKRYKFAIFPKTDEERTQQLTQHGTMLRNGTYELSDGESVTVNMIIYNDGLMADFRSSTLHSDAFLEDLLGWESSEYGFCPVDELAIRRFYSSELYVRMDSSLDVLNSRLKQIGEEVSSRAIEYSRPPFEIVGISFLPDPAIVRTISGFRLEREAGTPFSDNRYYSVAPLQTEAHLGLLEELEKVLGV